MGLAKPRFEDLIQHLWQPDGQQGLLPRRVARDATGRAELRAQEDDTQVQVGAGSGVYGRTDDGRPHPT